MGTWLGFLDSRGLQKSHLRVLVKRPAKQTSKKPTWSITALAKLLNQAQFKEDRLIFKTICVTVIFSGRKG